MGHNYPSFENLQQPGNRGATPPEPGILQHYDPKTFPYPQALKQKGSYKGSSPTQPAKLTLPLASAKAGVVTTLSVNAKTYRFRCPAWVRNNELMYFLTSDGSVCWVKIEIETKAGNAAALFIALYLLVLLIARVLHIPMLDELFHMSGIDTTVDRFLLIAFSFLVTDHLLTLFLHKKSCRENRPLPEDKTK